MKTLISIISLMGLLGLAMHQPPHTCASVRKDETVVLLHGLARSSKAMNKMERKLAEAGYHVINHDYPSTTATIEDLTNDVFQALEQRIKNADTVHFVTHSMGGLILREHLEDNELPNLGRVVMLAPPSQGSEVADKLGNIFLYQWINGAAGNQLGTGTDSHPLRLKAPAFELGIIAGDRTINPILSMLIPGADDGKVAVARVKPERYDDYILLHATHPMIVRNRTAIKQTIHFLKHGHFNRDENCTKTIALNNRLYAQRGTHPLRLQPF